jgi:hypothetical protein
MQVKELCCELAYCETESAAINLLEKQGFWNNPNAWHYYGDNENNFATIGNQQSRPESALVEKIINSVDAMLMAKCLKRGIDPETPKAPHSITEALIGFFNIHDGRLKNLTPKERGKLAENISLVATGTKTNPCYAIIDRGEGQTPKQMPNTLLSLPMGRSNKLRIPFVQGTFNMGGTGVFQFCGRRNLQLIISKRHPEVSKFEKDESKHKWGFTIVRREDPSSGMKSSIYRYLAPFDEIPSFESDGLPLLPADYPEPYGEKLEWGTFIKLYEYQMTGLKTALYYDPYYRLSLLMPNVALPIRFYERRRGYSAHSYEITMSGLSVRLDKDKSNNLEENFPTSSTFSVLGQKMKASIYVFKKGQSEKYTKDEGIIFTINGQTHAHISKAFFSRQAVGMGYLSDSLLVIVDCSDFDGRAREDLFMNSRDRLRSGDLRSEIERNIEELLKNHQGLRELRARRRREEIENKIGDSKPLVDVIESILKKSPTLSKLFMEGVRIPNPFKFEKAEPEEVYTGKKFPTYFTLIEKHPVRNPKNCPMNIKFRVQYKTDAMNDYFSRDNDPGTFSLKMDGEEIEDYSLNLWNGYANLNGRLPLKSAMGDVLHFESEVNDISRIEPFLDEFYVRIQPAVKKYTSKPGERKPPSSDKKDGQVEKTSYLEIPPVIEVRMEEWGSHSFSEKSALRVIDNGEDGYDFFVNMDNIYLLTEKKGYKTIDPKLLDARYKYGMALIGIAFLHEQKSKTHNTNGDNGEENVFTKISFATEVISPILLPMIAGLGDLQIEEGEKAYEES